MGFTGTAATSILSYVGDLHIDDFGDWIPLTETERSLHRALSSVYLGQSIIPPQRANLLPGRLLVSTGEEAWQYPTGPAVPKEFITAYGLGYFRASQVAVPSALELKWGEGIRFFLSRVATLDFVQAVLCSEAEGVLEVWTVVRAAHKSDERKVFTCERETIQRFPILPLYFNLINSGKLHSSWRSVVPSDAWPVFQRLTNTEGYDAF